MDYFKAYNKKNKKKNKFIPIFWISIIIALLVFFSKVNVPGISNIAGGITSAVVDIAQSAKGVITGGFEYFGNTKKIKTENQKLKEEIKDLEYKLLEIKKIEADNESLREKLEIKERYNHFKLIYADIVIKNYDNFDETFIIDRGTNNGVKEKQTVITKDGLLGYISKVSKNTSVVTTILDPNVSVGVEISSVNKNALVKGDFSLKNEGKLKLTYIPIDVEISKDEIVYTSGIGEVYPKGVPVGKIEKVINKKNEIDRYAVIKPLADISNVTSVGVIID